MDCGWLAKPLFVTWGAEREGNGGIKDRSIALCVSCQTFIPFPVFLMPGQPASNLWQTRATRLAGYLLLGVALALSLSKGTHWLCWIGLYCTVLYVERACVTNRSRSVRPFFLAIGL